MKYSYIIAVMLLSLLHSTAVWAQEVQVKGKVTSQEDNTALPGVSVLVKGTTQGTTTDADGGYSFNVPDGNSTLVFSFIGFTPVEVALNNRTTVDIALVADIQQLGEIVVIGYGTQRKVDLTGSVSVIDTEEVMKISNSNISTMLQGKAAGVQVTTDGQPGADPTIRIRGIGTFGSTDPLYVVDGVIIGTTVRDFSPNDIESIQILKDAAAAAIYGSRAGNGVVIITTKAGKKNQPMKVDYTGYLGVDNVMKGMYDVMDSNQYGKYVTTAYTNSSVPVPEGYDPASPKYVDPARVNTNWFDEAFKQGIRQNHNFNISGGSANSSYNVGLDYFSQKGTIVGAGPNYDRYTARINNTFDVKFIKFRTGIVYSHSGQNNMALSNANEYVQGLYGAQFPVMASVSIMPPTIKAYDPSTWVLDSKISSASEYKYDSYGYGTYYDDVHGDLRVTNVLLTNSLLKRHSNVDRVLASGSASVDLIEMVGAKSSNHKLSYGVNLAYSKTYAQDLTFVPAFIQSTTNYLTKSNERLTKGYRDYTNSLVENTITYSGTVGRNHINLVAGQTFQQDLSSTTTATGVTLPEPYILQVQQGASYLGSSRETKSVLASYFGRAIYDFDEKYLLTASLRRDASSRLNPVQNTGVFPSVSAGWRLDREDFFPIDESTVSVFKVRGSWGVLGNLGQLGEYPYTSTIKLGDYTYSFGNTKVTGSSISNFVNSAIKWEKKTTIDVGLDLGMFNDQIEFTFDWYKATSQDLLLNVPIPTSAGSSNPDVAMNAATMVNSGLEFLLAYHNRQHEVKFDISANLSTTRNKVTSLGVGQPIPAAMCFTQAGQPVGSFYGYVSEGIFQTQDQIDNRVNSKDQHVNQNGAQLGDVAYADLDNNGEITNADQQFLGSGVPKVNYGLNLRAEWKGLDLSLFVFGAAGFKAVDFVDMTLHSSYGALNKSVDLTNAWTPDNTNTSVPRVAYKTTGSITNDMFSTRYIQNASYLKVGSVQLGYNFPDKLFGGYIERLRIYATGQNLMRFTSYKGYNPDFAGGTLSPGYNYASYPSPRTFMFGGSFSF